MNGKNSIQALEKEIADLEYRLRNARTRLTLARSEGHRELPSNGSSRYPCNRHDCPT
jgi:urease accessory protein